MIFCVPIPRKEIKSGQQKKNFFLKRKLTITFGKFFFTFYLYTKEGGSQKKKKLKSQLKYCVYSR